MATPRKESAELSNRGLVQSEEGKSPEEVAGFWTDEKIRTVTPIPMPALPARPMPPLALPNEGGEARVDTVRQKFKVRFPKKN